MQLKVCSESSQDLVRKAPFQTPPHIYSLRIPKDGAQESIYFNSVGDNTWTMFKNSSRTVKLRSTNRESNAVTIHFAIQKSAWVLPGGSVVKNPPAKAGNTGLIPDPGRSQIGRAHV